VWYGMLAVSFLACSLNPVGAAGLAMHILKPHDIYSTPLGYAMTAGSFVIAVMGFIATERVAYMERQRRALEFASLATCGAAVLAFVLGFTLPMVVMWPIAAVLVAVGGLGFRAATGLPVPGGAGTGSPVAHSAGVAGGVARRDAPSSPRGANGAAAAPGRKRRRRRRRRKPRASTPPSGGGV